MRVVIVLAAAVAIGACGRDVPAPRAAPVEHPTSAATAETIPAQRPARGALEIGPDGIGPVSMDMTVGQIRNSLPEGIRLGDIDERLMVDLVGVPVIRGADTLLYLVFPAGDDVSNDAKPTLLMTNHPSVQTMEGIGPGSTLDEAARTYGAATLRYSALDEMREYVSFGGFHHPQIRFRVAPGDTVLLAGKYAGEGEFGETAQYDGNARIMMVFVE